jgi:hypothetical protein
VHERLQTLSSARLAIDLLLYLLYLPMGLTVARLLCCEDGRFLYERQHRCGGAAHVQTAVYLGLAYLAAAIYFPFNAARRVYLAVPYPRPRDHETYVQGTEVEQLLDLSRDWMNGSFWLFSSFRLGCVYHWVAASYHKLFFVLIYTMT